MFVVSFSKNRVETIIVIIVIFLLHNNRIQKSQYRPSLMRWQNASNAKLGLPCGLHQSMLPTDNTLNTALLFVSE